MMDNTNITEPVPVPAIPTHSRRRVWIIAGSVSIIGVLVLLLASNLLSFRPVEQNTVSSAPTPTPTPVRVLSEIATQSAFVALEAAHASLSAGLTVANLDDPSLSPPVLDLPLGFAQ